MKPCSLHSLISSLSAKCECNSFYHRSTLCLHVCVTHIYSQEIMRNIFKLIAPQTFSPSFIFYFFLATNQLFPRSNFPVILYNMVSHTQYYCNNGRPSIEIGGDALKCCVSVCSAVWVEIRSRQIRCGYLDLDLHMCFARSALILLTFTWVERANGRHTPNKLIKDCEGKK